MAVGRAPPPFILEDRTGLLTTSDFDDIYDRLFLRVAEHATPMHRLSSSPPTTQSHRTLLVFDMNHRWSPRRDSHSSHSQRPPRAVMQFGAHDALGTVEFALAGFETTMHMTKYLQKTSMFARYVCARILLSFQSIDKGRWRLTCEPSPDSSLSRQFVGSDGRRYRWSFHVPEKHEWAVRDRSES
jgi:hypothetical protein